jgi:hypothetical protein
LYDKHKVPSRILEELRRAAPALENMPDAEAQREQITEPFKHRMDELDETIWAVLNATQVRELQRILGQSKPPARRPPPKAKRATRSG